MKSKHSHTSQPKQHCFGTIVVFGDDWGRHPSSSQHLVKRLGRNRKVIWVNSVGMRAPRLALSDFKRIFERLLKLFRPSTFRAENGTNFISLNPLVVPLHSIGFIRKLNQFTIKLQLSSALKHAPKPVVAWISNPLATYLLQAVQPDILIYYCGDDFLQFGGPTKLIANLEQQLLEQADLCVFSSKHLAKNKAAHPERSLYLPHAVEFEHFSNSCQPDPALGAIPRPMIGYFGIFSEWIDLKFLEQVVKLASTLNFVLIGRPSKELEALRRYSNVYLLGEVPYEHLPSYAQSFSVGLLLYKNNALTAAINPLKLLEYFAMGLPVVSTRKPEGVVGAEELLVATEPKAFNDCIVEALKISEDKRAYLRKIARLNSWDERAALVEQRLIEIQNSKAKSEV